MGRTTCVGCDRRAVRVCERCLWLAHEAARLEGELRSHPVAMVYLLARDLDWLAELERDRGVAWLENHVGRLRALVAAAHLAEIGRKKLYVAEQHRHDDALEAKLDDERLVAEFDRLKSEGKSIKEIGVQLGRQERDRLRFLGKKIPRAWEDSPVPSLSKDRLARLAKLSAAQAKYRARFPRRS